MRALVTGGAGFIGSHVVDLLVYSGYDVTVVDNISQGNVEWINKSASFYEGDVTDLDLMRSLCKRQDVVFHLAAMSRVLPSLSGGPSACLFSEQQNILGTLNVLIASSENEVMKVVYSASSTAYGNSSAPHKEDGKTDLITPYAVSKFVGELYCEQFTKMYGLKTACLRYFQVYGPRQPISGEYATVAGIFINQFKAGLPLTIHGDGSQKRDFVHVKDIAKANLLAFERDACGTINVGTGNSHSIKYLADIISDNQSFLPNRKFDMIETKADTERCSHLLGWSPEIDFETGIKELLNAAD